MAEPSVASLHITTPVPHHRERQHQRPATGRGGCCHGDAQAADNGDLERRERPACVFLYRRTGAEGCPTITLSSTWGHSLDSRVLKAWDDVANRHATRKILVETRALAGKDFKSQGSVVGVLELRRLVLHQVSLCQVRWEAENC